MTSEGRAKGHLKRWQKILRIPQWQLAIDFVTPCEGNNTATSHWSWDYETGFIRLETGWQDWPDERLEELIVHELLHIVFRDLAVLASHVCRTLPKGAGQLCEWQLDHEVEGIIERLSLVLTAVDRAA